MWLSDRQTHAHTDRRRTKWSLCAAKLRRRYKNWLLKSDEEAHNGLVSMVFTSLFPYMSIMTLTFDLQNQTPDKVIPMWGETGCPGGVCVSCLTSRTRHEMPATQRKCHKGHILFNVCKCKYYMYHATPVANVLLNISRVIALKNKLRTKIRLGNKGMKRCNVRSIAGVTRMVYPRIYFKIREKGTSYCLIRSPYWP